jgi:hypothetical protein
MALLDLPHMGHIIIDTNDKIVVLGDRNDRYNIPKSEVKIVVRKVLIGLNHAK